MQTEVIDKISAPQSHGYGNLPSLGGKKPRKRRGNKKVVTDDAAKQPITAPTSVGPNNKKKRNHVKKSDLSTLNLPQLKLVLRSVGDVDRYGTNEKMVSLIRDLIDTTNKSMTAGVSDDSFSTTVILDEESVQKVLLTRTNDEDMDGKHEMVEKLNDTVEANDKILAASDESGTQLSSALGSHGSGQSGVQSSKNATTARILYLLPTRKSRRRGEIPGRAYILLQPPMPMHILQKINSSRCESSTDVSCESVDITPSDRSKAVSQSRTTLSSTLNCFEKILQADSVNEQRFRRARIELCLNSKTWKTEKPFGAKTSKHISRLESTLESSDDYKQFLEKRAKSEEDRLNRPKPIAGGIVSGTNAQSSNSENAMPMSALLLHLRAKREQESKKRRESTKPRPNSVRQPASTTKTDKNSSDAKDPNEKRKSKSTTSREKGSKSDAKAASVNSIKRRAKVEN